MKHLSSRARMIMMAAGFLTVFGFGNTLRAQDETQKSLEVYGFAMVDMGYNFDQIDPR